MTRIILLAKLAVPGAALSLLLAGCPASSGADGGTAGSTGGSSSSGGTSSSGGSGGTCLGEGTCDGGGQFCDQTVCRPKLTTGPCADQPGYHSANEVCLSGLCLGGACCTDPQCPHGGGRCAATACDAVTGRCLVADAGTLCGGPFCDAGSVIVEVCDDVGACTYGQATPCAPFACYQQYSDDGQCLTSCIPGEGNCASNAYCTGTCCAFLDGGVYVDSVRGSDQGCCGTPEAPCASLATALYAMAVSSDLNATLYASVDGGGGDWTGNESWPVQLNLGVTLQAPGVFFAPTQDRIAAFQVVSPGAYDVAPVTIQGNPAAFGTDAGKTPGPEDFVYIGFDSQGGHASNTAVGIDDGSDGGALPLALKLVWVNGRVAGIFAGPGARVDAPPSNPLASSPSATVVVGGFSGGTGTVSGTTGIECQGATINGLFGVSHQVTDLDAKDFCDASFASGSTFGTSPSGNGLGLCNAKPDQVGILMSGASTVTVQGVLVSCMQGDGIQLASASDAGAPSFDVGGAAPSSIVNCGCSGIHVLAGTVSIGNTGASATSQVQHNHFGIHQEGTGTISAERGVFTCNSATEPGNCASSGDPGVDVWNSSAANLIVGSAHWDHLPPEVLTCSDQFQTCVCSVNGGCGGASRDGVDVAITPDLAGQTGTVDTSGGALSPSSCP
jgi:hypothetical protein